jgi:hypothetical protein
MNDSFQVIGTAVTAIVAVIAVIYAYRQTELARTGHFAERRPYLVPSYEVSDSDKGVKRVFLVITNYGNTPAKDVTLEFSSNAAWHDIKYADHFPFLTSNNGISVIPPGSRNSFFVGNLSTNSCLQVLRTEEITASVHFGMYERQDRISDSFRLSLKDFAGSVSLGRKTTPRSNYQDSPSKTLSGDPVIRG